MNPGNLSILSPSHSLALTVFTNFTVFVPYYDTIIRILVIAIFFRHALSKDAIRIQHWNPLEPVCGS